MDEALVKFSGIKKSYPGKTVLKDVTFEIKKATVHGFLGPNGAGKSTLMNLLLGEIELDSGEINCNSNIEIGYLPEHLPLYMNMKVRNYLNFVQEIYDKADRNYLDKVIEQCGLGDVQERMISHLSKGYKQRVGLAQALCHKPDLLVLDEPMVGLDPHALIQMKELLKELSKEHTIFISSHQLHELAQVCTHISILNEGEIVKSGTLQDVEKEVNRSQIVEVEFQEEFTQDIYDKIERDLHLKVEKLMDNQFRFISEGDEDLRLILSNFFSQNKLTVLSQTVKKLDLEEIFKTTTSRGDV